jgi:osmoprotectant transport system permease protein
MLQADAATLQRLKGNKDNLYRYVQSAFKKRFAISWLEPIGFNNAYVLMMRRQQAREMNIRSISDLKRQTDKQKQ